MQPSKTRAGSVEVPQRASRKVKTSGSDSDNGFPQSPATRNSLEQSPKVGRRSPRTPTSEKKRSSKVSELEAQVAQLEQELKKAKDQLSQPEPSTNPAHQEAEEATEAEATIASLKLELSKTLDLVEDFKTQMNDSKEIKSKNVEAMKAYESLAMELEQTKAELDKNKKLVENLEKSGSKEEKDFENGMKMKKMELDLEEVKMVLRDKERELVGAQAELRRVKVQSEQWRKAAEVAAAMLSGGNGKHGVDLGYCDEMEDESSKKRNGNMLKKIGVLLKKK